MKEKQTNKKYLTHEDVFDTTSESYSKMMDIVNSNQNFPKIVTSGRELHHIVERNFSKKAKALIDNRAENLVSLSKTDHFLAHVYAYGCAKPVFRSGAARAVTMMRKYLLCGDISKNEFVMELLAESKALSDSICRDSLNKGRKKRKGSFTLSVLDAVMARVLSKIGREKRVSELYTTLGIIGRTHNFPRYISNAMRDVPDGAPNDVESLLIKPLSEIMKLVFGDLLKTWRVNDHIIENNMRAYIFLLWLITKYYREDYNEHDTLDIVLDKFADDIADIEYEMYIESLEPLRDIRGKWYNDGATSGRFIKNPDPEFWCEGRC